MGGLFDGARNFFRGFVPPVAAPPQRFSVACPDGHLVSGLRTEGYQALRCPTCGEGVFVLPRSPLPEPVVSSPRTKARSLPPPVDEGPIGLSDPVGAAEADDEIDVGDEIEWIDVEGSPTRAETTGPAAGPVAHRPWPDPGELAAEEIESERRGSEAESASGSTPEARDRGRSRRPRSGPDPADAGPRPVPSRSRSRPAQRPPRPVRQEVVDDPYHDDAVAYAPEPEGPPRAPLSYRLGQWARARRNTLIFAGVALVVLATVAYRVHRARVAGLPRVAERGWTEGLPALDAGNFDAARQLLSEARDAVDTLGDVSEHASDIRQGAAEIAILTQLCPDPLEDLLDQAARSDAKEWTRQFDRIYKGRSVIFDARVTSVRGGPGQGRYEIDYQVFRPGEGARPASQARIDLKGLALVETLKPRIGDRLTFGARLASFTFDTDENGWRVGLVPDSGVTITHRKALEKIGWPAGDDLRPEDERQ